jgi:hypothetical protein
MTSTEHLLDEAEKGTQIVGTPGIHPDDFATISQRYREMAAKRDAEQAKATRQAQERARQREALVPDFWHDRRIELGHRQLASKANQAWDAFADAVLNGGDTVTRWVEYRTAVTVTAAEWRAINTYAYLQERAQAREAREMFDQITREGDLLNQLRPGSGGMTTLDSTEYSTRLRAYNRALSAYAGIHRDPTKAPMPKHLVPVPKDEPWSPRDYDESVKSYGDAIDRVTQLAEQRAVQQADQQRELDLDAYLEERVP